MKIKKHSPKSLDGRLDIAWSRLVKERAGYKCEYCLAKNKQLHSHHIYSRSKKSTRWDVVNGVCLCASHHVLSSVFSAHKTGVEFTEWLYNKKGDKFMVNLRLKAHSIKKFHPFEKKELLKLLEGEITNIDEINRRETQAKKDRIKNPKNRDYLKPFKP